MASTDRSIRLPDIRSGQVGGTAYIRQGQGPTLVFVHGVGMNKAVWNAQFADFVDQYDVVAYDLLGHGESDLPPDPTYLSDLCDQLLRLLDDLGISEAYVVGHSMGALVATEFALRHPARVCRLIALNAVYRRSEAQRRSVLVRANEISNAETPPAVDETVQRWFTPDECRRAPTDVARVKAWLASANATGYARIYRAFATSDDVFISRMDSLEVPALFMTGERDPNSTPEMSRQLADEAPLGRAIVIEKERHMMAYITPAIVNSRIRAFIEQQ